MRIKKTRGARAGALWLGGLLLAPLVVFAQAQMPRASPMQVLPLTTPVVTPVGVDAAPPPHGAAPMATASAAPLPATAEAPWESPARVGDSTQRLLALQRGGQVASATPRPLPGEIAQRSRERYLKSFEYPIPERFQSSVSQKAAPR